MKTAYSIEELIELGPLVGGAGHLIRGAVRQGCDPLLGRVRQVPNMPDGSAAKSWTNQPKPVDQLRRRQSRSADRAGARRRAARADARILYARNARTDSDAVGGDRVHPHLRLDQPDPGGWRNGDRRTQAAARCTEAEPRHVAGDRAAERAPTSTGPGIRAALRLSSECLQNALDADTYWGKLDI